MKRRTVLVGLGAAAGGGALATGAFDSATAERSATIGLADDANAFLALEPLDDDFAFLDDDGELGLVFDEVEGGGTGFGSNTVYETSDVFEVRNQGTEDVGLFAEVDDGELGDAEFDLLVDGEVLGPEPTVPLDVGTAVPVGVRVDAGDDPTDGEVTITIGADTELEAPPDDPPVEGTVGSLSFYSSASQRAPDGSELADDDVALVRGESTAFNFESDGGGPPPVIYEDNDVPLVSRDTTDPVIGFGTPEFVADGNGGFDQQNEQFLVNLFDDLIGPDATIAWDESHGQFWGLDSYDSFSAYAEDEGYDLQASSDLVGSGASLSFPSTASQVASGGDAALTDPSRILVWAESTAENVDTEGDGAYIYDDDTDIPIVSREGDVVGFGTPELFEDGDLSEVNEQFGLNLLADTVGPSGTLLWDDAHDTLYTSDEFGEFADAIEAEGYTFESSGEEGLLSEAGALVADPADANATATHTWTLEDVAFGEPGNDGDEVDTITVEYPDGTSLDGLTNEDVTVTMTRTLSGGEDTSEISVNSGNYSGTSATFDLSGILQTDVAGPIEIVVEGVENPAAGEYEASATLDGDADPVTETVDFEIGNDAGGAGTIDADAVAIPSPSESYSDDELSALSDFVADGGTVWLLDESEFQNEETANLNDIAAELSLDFAFNPDQVEDDVNNAGPPFVPTTTNFNEEGYEDVFDGIEGVGLDDVDGVVITTPSRPFNSLELDELEAFVDDGGAVFLLDQSDFDGFDETENLNEVADTLDLDFRFNSDQVNDEESNVGPEFDVLTENYDADPDDLGVFAERDRSIAVNFERGEAYYGRVVRVFDGDTFEIEFDSDYGYRDVIRNLGIDTAETGGATNEPEEWFGIPDDELDHLDTWGGNATDFALDVMAPDGADAGDEDIEGRRIRAVFGEREPLRGNFGRLLMFMEYDPNDFDADPEDGNFSVDYNKETVEEGYARVYSSGFARHDEFAAEEEAALADGERVWSASDFDALDEIRNDGSVLNDQVFVPRASSVTSTTGPLNDDQIVLPAEDTAEQESLPDGDGFDSYDQPPLVAMDDDNGVAMVGGVLLHERYEPGEGAGVEEADEPERYRNFALFTNVADELSETTGDVIIEGGHAQFDIPGSVPLERVQFYLRYVEGLGGRLRQINDVVETLPAEEETPRAVFLTAPDRPYTDNELNALTDYQNAGGAVVLVGSAAAPASARENLNDVAAALGTDLRLNDDRVVDADSNLADTPEFPVSGSFDPDDSLFGPASIE